MNKKILLLVFLGFFLISLASAEQQTLGTFRKDSCIQLIQSHGNCTYNNISSVYQTDSSTLYEIYSQMTKSGTFYNYTFCNTSIVGEYIVTGVGDPDGLQTSWTYNFYVTLRGTRVTSGEAIVYGIVVLILFALMISCIMGIKRTDKIYLKMGFGYLAYLFLIILSYVTWITSTSMIETAFIDKFFYWVFIVLTIGFIPGFFGSLVFYLYKVITIAPIQRMINEGVPEDRAYADKIRRDLNKKQKWF